MNAKIVYFAGKVSKGGGYRGKLLGNSRCMSDVYAVYSISGGKLIYGGPFALACDHGCFHQSGHGLLDAGCEYGDAKDLDEVTGLHGLCDGLTQEEAVNRCLSQIRDCHAVHAYLDTISCYGTLVELGYAAAMAKPIYIYYADETQNWDKHFWFAMNLPGIKHCGPGTKSSIHPDLITPEKSYKERYHEYLLSDDWKEIRANKLKEAGGRCQLCNKRGTMHVHHRTYDRVFHEQPRDLIALCGRCHRKFHNVSEEAV
jgi:hypothetical protein